ncbi:response regulator transcription factor [Mucilaginibacter sp. 44-25]|uniref:response regulator transcription factor n=1 Tax=Mucilaginibacter sp. 44-25 TaxID=1895794 RepID=UPI000967EB91|nr:response regulator transcription factor [Mucilaginibacter sp. 44-25]OJW13194.1 MAG: two-component system response regulator [Mucilaginibacter sp. 44-25]
MSRKILYIEDEPFLARIVSDGLIASGYDVQIVTDGKLALNIFKNYHPDICLLDIMLPSKDGYQLAEEIRVVDHKVPILFLSAKALTTDVLKGFASGGDDYLKKPFHMDELLARVSVLIRRSRIHHKDVEPAISELKFGKCSLDVVKQILTTSTGRTSLTFKECLLLKMLIESANDVLTRQSALMNIWNDDSYYSTRSMDVFIAHLRKLIKNETGIQILTLRGIGYKLLVC